MKPVLVLAMHGAPPTDFPREEISELFMLHGQLAHAPAARRATIEQRYAELDAKIRAWPRTPQNDPFWAASLELGAHLAQAAGCEVLVGFNEFCAPSLDETLDQAAVQGATEIVVVTPMMTRGGEHSEIEIPSAIEQAAGRHPGISFRYVWPFETGDVAQFLASQITKSGS